MSFKKHEPHIPKSENRKNIKINKAITLLTVIGTMLIFGSWVIDSNIKKIRIIK